MRNIKKILAILVVFGMLFSSSCIWQERQIDKYDNYQIYFYNAEQGDKEKPKKPKCGTGIPIGGNQNYAGAKVWSDAELATIEENRPIYEEAANEHGFPWQVLATLHSMERSLMKDNPGNGQGVYQLYTYTDGGRNENAF